MRNISPGQPRLAFRLEERIRVSSLPEQSNEFGTAKRDVVARQRPAFEPAITTPWRVMRNSYAANNGQIITLGNPEPYPTVTTINPMWLARAFANGIVLPDGKVFITGGQTYAVPFTDTNVILTPGL